jgi:hypothetical protein
MQHKLRAANIYKRETKGNGTKNKRTSDASKIDRDRKGRDKRKWIQESVEKETDRTRETRVNQCGNTKTVKRIWLKKMSPTESGYKSVACGEKIVGWVRAGLLPSSASFHSR